MKLKCSLILASLLSMSAFTVGKVEANNNLEIYTPDSNILNIEYDVSKEKGSQEQLSKVKPETMEFIKNIAYPAYIIGNEYDVYPSVTIAQAVLESGYGKSKLAKSPNHNFFGVKGSYNGESVTISTSEDDGSGNKFSIEAKFKKYPSPLESLEDHGILLRERLNGFYKGVWRENAKTPEEATAYLQGRYATDTEYSSKLNSIIETYNLKRFDSQLDSADIEWLKSNSLDPWEKEVKNIKEVKEVRTIKTWATGLQGTIKPRITIGDLELENYNKEYLQNHLGEDFSEMTRTKKQVGVGYGIVYESQNYLESEERYGVVESIEKDYILISEGIRGEMGVNVIYRVIPKEFLYKYEFIEKEIL